MWGITSVHVGDNISTVEGIQYCGGVASVLLGDNSSRSGGYLQSCGDTFSTVMYRGGYSVQWGIPLIHVGDSISTVGITSVLWKVFSTVEEHS